MHGSSVSPDGREPEQQTKSPDHEGEQLTTELFAGGRNPGKKTSGKTRVALLRCWLPRPHSRENCMENRY